MGIRFLYEALAVHEHKRRDKRVLKHAKLLRNHPVFDADDFEPEANNQRLWSMSKRKIDAMQHEREHRKEMELAATAKRRRIVAEEHERSNKVFQKLHGTEVRDEPQV